MAVLTDAKRTECSNELMQELSDLRQELSNIARADIKATADATDTWINDNQASFNAALPLTFRTNASASQKSRFFRIVARKREEEGA